MASTSPEPRLATAPRPRLAAWLGRRTPAPLRRYLRGLLGSRPAEGDERIQTYLRNGRVPWSPGYSEYKRRHIARLLLDDRILEIFRTSAALPPGYGERLDERVVEYPWLFSRPGDWGACIVDAGSTLNYPTLLAHPRLRERAVVVYNLQQGWRAPERRVTYVTGDLRAMGIRADTVDLVVCISTLEHIGLDATRLYTRDPRFREDRPQDFRLALREFRRVLRPGGRLMVTVPFGRAANLGWLQQFDRGGVDEIERAFGGEALDASFFKYEPDGWRRAASGDCVACEYFDIHATPGSAPDYAAAARAVACLDLCRPPR
jgi:SAM-dependent methyltransferase